MLRETPNCELTDNPDYQRWLFEVMRAEWEEEQRQDRRRQRRRRGPKRPATVGNHSTQ
jgi:hypothetical protein